MFKLVKTLFNICLLREGPEEIPHSYALLGLMIFINFSVSLFIGSISQNVKIAGPSSIAILFFTFLFAKILLLKRPERFMQTFSAMLGVDTLISIVSIPSIYFLGNFKLSETAAIFFSLTVFALFIWVIIVYGHIFSKALSVLIGYGVAISTGYAVLSIIILDLFLAGNTPT